MQFFHLGVRAARITELGRRRKGRTLSIFSKESARRGVQPSMASPATAESQAGQPAATCSPRALLAKLGPGPRPLRDERERLSRRAGFSAGAAGCSTFQAASCWGQRLGKLRRGWAWRRGPRESGCPTGDRGGVHAEARSARRPEGRAWGGPL